MILSSNKEIFWKKTKISNREFELSSGGTVIALLKRKSLLKASASGEINGRVITFTPAGKINKTITVAEPEQTEMTGETLKLRYLKYLKI